MTEKMISLHRFISIVWLALIISLAGFSYRALVIDKRIQTDILALLPSSHTEPIKAVRQLLDDTQVTQKILILVGHNDSKVRKETLNRLRHSLSSLPIKEISLKEISEEYHKLFKHLYAYRAALLTDDDHTYLGSTKHDELITRALAEITSPFSPVNLQEDPFSFFIHFVKANQQNAPFQMDHEGDLYIQGLGLTWSIFIGNLMDSAFSMDMQQSVADTLLPALENLSKDHGVRILRTGGIFYATAGANQAKSEISFISLISTIGIILMMLLVFKSLRPLFFAICVITTAIITGFATCLFVFGHVHVLAIVIGCTLVGITVDYALHYTCASYAASLDSLSCNSVKGFQVLKKLMPALPLSAISSAAGYALLLLVPFPGIQQMALLSCIGLLAAFVSVSLWGPYIINHQIRTIPTLASCLQKHLERLALLGNIKAIRLSLAGAVLVIVIGGIWSFSTQDNVRYFQALDPTLKAQEDQIKSMMDLDTSSTFLAVQGSSIEEILQREEDLIPYLSHMNIPYRCLATLIPSQRRQGQNLQLLANFYKENLPKLAHLLGQSSLTNSDHLGLNTPPLSLKEVHLPTGFKELIHTSPSGLITGRIMIMKPGYEKELKQLTQGHSHLYYINANQEYSDLFTTYRTTVTWLTGVVILSILTLLALKVGIKSAIQIGTPVVLSLSATVGFLSMLMPFNLFHIMGLLLVLCIGIDYALFLFWRKKGQNSDLSLLGNSLAALTTILSFGLLAFSKTPIVYSFGLSVFIGIFLCFIITTLFLGKGKSQDA